MHHKFVSSMVVALALSTGLSGATSPPPLQAADVETLVNGSPQPRYAHDGRWYVEAVKGREYKIRRSAVFFKEREPMIGPESANTTTPRSAPSAVPFGESSTAETASARRKASDEYAATGMGQRTDQPVFQVRIDLEETPAQTVNIRYEYHAQLVRLGILPAAAAVDPLQRRERAQRFEPGFSPEPPRR